MEEFPKQLLNSWKKFPKLLLGELNIVEETLAFIPEGTLGRIPEKTPGRIVEGIPGHASRKKNTSGHI